MPLPLTLLLFVAGFFVCAVPAPGHAQAIVDQQDAQLWLQVNSQIPLTPTSSLLVEGQPRWGDNFSRYDQVVLRAGVLTRLTPRIHLGGAYALVPRRTVLGTVVEHQAYQQAIVVLPRVGPWMAQVRVREDQRYLSQWGESAHRIRGQVRMSRAVPSAEAWTLVLHGEVFVNWDRTPRGPARGLDQRRVFLGANHRLTRDLAIEAGYMSQGLFRLESRPAGHNHIALVQLQIRPGTAGRPAPPRAHASAD